MFAVARPCEVDRLGLQANGSCMSGKMHGRGRITVQDGSTEDGWAVKPQQPHWI